MQHLDPRRPDAAALLQVQPVPPVVHGELPEHGPVHLQAGVVPVEHLEQDEGDGEAVVVHLAHVADLEADADDALARRGKVLNIIINVNEKLYYYYYIDFPKKNHDNPYRVHHMGGFG